MTHMIGGSPGTVYTETEVAQGKCPTVGTVAEFQMAHVQGSSTAQFTGTYIMCKVGASQNLTNGHLVQITRAAGGAAPDWVVIVSPVASGVTAAQTLGVAVCSLTASASMQIWVQVYGRGVVQASLSALPNIVLKVGSVAGNVDDDVTVSASSVIDGLVLLNTSSVAAALCACFINYPHISGSVANA